MAAIRAILVSVGYSDILRLTLPWNRRHFAEVAVVTSPDDAPNVEPITRECDAKMIVSDRFFPPGALFAKWAGLEHGLDIYGRHGCLCVMDADIAWPRTATLDPQPGYLYTPFRRMADPAPAAMPDESTWTNYQQHRQCVEYAGYTQVFFADDVMAGPPPWYDPRWISAGSADSFFQARWPESRKVRPGFDVLHLGPAGVNWAGRVSPHLDGTVPPGADARRAALREMLARRRLGPNRFAHERLPE